MRRFFIAIAIVVMLFAGCQSSREVLSLGADYSNRFDNRTNGDLTARVEYRVEILR